MTARDNPHLGRPVFSRYPGQRIFIGDSITIIIVKVKGQRVWVLCEVPKNIEVSRPDKDQDKLDLQGWSDD